MPTFIEIANDLAKHFIVNTNKKAAADYIVREINGLVLNDTNEPLDANQKKLLIDIIGEFLSKQRPLQYKDGGRVLIVESRDNTSYLELVEYMLNELNK